MMMINRKKYADKPDTLAKDYYVLSEEDIDKYGEDVTLDTYCKAKIAIVQNTLKEELQLLIQKNNEMLRNQMLEPLEKRNKALLAEVKTALNITDKDWSIKYEEFAKKYGSIITDKDQMTEALLVQIMLERKTILTPKQKTTIAKYFENKRNINYVYVPMYYHEDLSVQIRKVFKDDEIKTYFPNTYKDINSTHEGALFLRNYIAQELQTESDVISQIAERPEGIKFYQAPAEMYKKRYPTQYKEWELQ